MAEKIIWKGKRTPLAEDNTVIMKISDGKFWANVPLYLDEVNHSPTGFEWGYYGSGPAQLSYAILRTYFAIFEGLSATEAKRQASRFYFKFKEKFVSKWKEEWQISSGEIAAWLSGETPGKEGWV